MDSLAHAVGWAAYLIDLIWALWFGIGLVVGGILLARDEWRLYLTRPRPEEVKAHADDLVARHGCEAFRISGDAMVAARHAKQFDRHRFLKEVSGKLAARLALEPRMGLDSIEDWLRPGAVQGSPPHRYTPVLHPTTSDVSQASGSERILVMKSTIRRAPPRV